MAKKNARAAFGMECSVCKTRNYVSQKNSLVTKDKMTLNKYCRKCRVSTEHNESKLK